MTLRRLAVLIFGLSSDSRTWRAYAAEQEKALVSAERIRERQAHYAKEAAQ